MESHKIAGKRLIPLSDEEARRGTLPTDPEGIRKLQEEGEQIVRGLEIQACQI
jgi:hypothetical protein